DLTTGAVKSTVPLSSGGVQSLAAPIVSTYRGPTVTAISPNKGPLTGGTTVTITGTNFTRATAVTFGSVAAPSATINSATSITATSPAGTGIVDVAVTSPAGTSVASSADKFAYLWATGDFDGDGKSDLAWRDTSGIAAVWMMNGATLSQSAGLGSAPIT